MYTRETRDRVDAMNQFIFGTTNVGHKFGVGHVNARTGRPITPIQKHSEPRVHPWLDWKTLLEYKHVDDLTMLLTEKGEYHTNNISQWDKYLENSIQKKVMFSTTGLSTRDKNGINVESELSRNVIYLPDISILLENISYKD